MGMTLHGGVTPEPVRVELDIFSGRPNPVWMAADEDAATIIGLVAALPAATTSSLANKSLANNLGYRGFIVQIGTGVGARTVRVQAGNVRVSMGDAVEWHSDRSHELERRLLASGASALSPDLYAIAESAVAESR